MGVFFGACSAGRSTHRVSSVFALASGILHQPLPSRCQQDQPNLASNGVEGEMHVPVDFGGHFGLYLSAGRVPQRLLERQGIWRQAGYAR